MTRRFLVLAGTCLAAGCAHGPQRADPQAYADALARGELKEAYALTSPRFQSQVTEPEFAQRNANPSERRAKAERIRAVVAQVDALAPELSSAPDPRIRAAREALTAFLAAAESRHFALAYPWLSAGLRARYTPSSLARDFSLAPDAGDRLRRARAAAEGPASIVGDRVLFPIAQGRAVELVEEKDGFKVAALE